MHISVGITASPYTLLNLDTFNNQNLETEENTTLASRLPNNTHIQVTYLAGHDRGKVLLLIYEHKVLKWSWLEEKGVSFLQRHGRRELWFIVIITQVSNLIQITNRKKYTYYEMGAVIFINLHMHWRSVKNEWLFFRPRA